MKLEEVPWNVYVMERTKQLEQVTKSHPPYAWESKWSMPPTPMKQLMLVHALLKNCEIRRTDTEDTQAAMKLLEQVIVNFGGSV